MKKGLLICSILLFIISDLVCANDINNDYFNGYYLGIGTGLSHTKSNINNVIKDNVINTESVFVETHLGEIDSDKAGSTQGIFNLFLGFGRVLNEYFYLGGELFLKYAPTANDISIKRFNGWDEQINLFESLTKINLKNIYSYGGNIRFGYLITDKVMFYGLIGLDNRFFKYRVKYGLNPYNPDGEELFFVKYDYGFKKNKLALTPGIGVEAIVYKNVSLRLQYSYSTYEKIKHHNDYSTNYVLEDVEYDYNSHAEDTIDLSKGVFTIDLSFRLDK